jgi:hypothetical protein
MRYISVLLVCTLVLCVPGSLTAAKIDLPTITDHSIPSPEFVPELQGQGIAPLPPISSPQPQSQSSKAKESSIGGNSLILLVLLIILTGALITIEIVKIVFGGQIFASLLLGIALALTTASSTALLYNLNYLIPFLPGRSARDALEVIYFIAQTIVAVVVFVAALYARQQVEEGRSARLAALYQSRATFLLELDRRWDSAEVSKSIRSFREIRDEALNEIVKNDPQIDMGLALQKVQFEFPEKLKRLRADKNTKDLYAELMVFPGLLETIGVMAKQDYINIDDIADLFEWSITDFNRYFTVHIQERQMEPGVPERFLQNALNLAEQVEKRVLRRNNPTLAS